MIASFKAIFFDAGGTLLHPFPSVGEIYQKVGAKYGCRAKADQLEKSFHEVCLRKDGLTSLASHSSEKVERDWWHHLVAEVFSGGAAVQDFETFFEELYDVFARPESWRLYPGVPEVLRELKKRGKRVGIVSNWDSRLFKLCEGLGLEKYVDFVLASAVFGASKPSPRIFEEALRQSRVLPEEAIHVGDSIEDDVNGALGAGLKAILIDRTHGGRSTPSVPTIRDLKELIADIIPY